MDLLREHAASKNTDFIDKFLNELHHHRNPIYREKKGKNLKFPRDNN